LRIALPLARPAIALGTSLALMEALNDVGAAEFLGVRTLTVQVYATWVNRSDLPGASQIALVMLAGVVTLVGLERLARSGRGYASNARRDTASTRRRLAGWRAGAVLALGTAPVATGFLLPAGYLAFEAWHRIGGSGLPNALAAQTRNTVLYASLATGVTVVVGLLVAAAPSLLSARAGRVLIRAAGLGYAMPGTVLAVGLLGPLALIDSGLFEAGITTALVGLGTGSALVIAYALRFQTVTLGACEAGFARIPRTLPDAARVLERGRLATLTTVQLPLAWPAVLSGGLLAFVDIAKELPVTLLLRPLNVETLSTHLYGEAARGTYEHGAAAAVLIVMIGLVPVTLLLRLDQNAKWRRG